MNPNEQPHNPQAPQQPLNPKPAVPFSPPVAPTAPEQPVVPVATQEPMPTPQAQPPIAPPAPVQPQPPFEPVAPQPVQPPVTPAPVTDPMPINYEQAPSPASGGILGLLNERAGLLSLIVFAVAFIALTVATLIDINQGLNELADFTASLGGNIEMPSFFEVTKTAVTHWIFVNIISGFWWVAGLLPALALAAYGLFKKNFKDIPAIITVVLVLEVYLNLIIK